MTTVARSGQAEPAVAGRLERGVRRHCWAELTSLPPVLLRRERICTVHLSVKRRGNPVCKVSHHPGGFGLDVVGRTEAFWEGGGEASLGVITWIAKDEEKLLAPFYQELATSFDQASSDPHPLRGRNYCERGKYRRRGRVLRSEQGDGRKEHVADDASFFLG